jgi:hypothetical protein
MYYKGRKGGDIMASTSDNKKQTTAFKADSAEKVNVNKEAAPKLVVENSTTLDSTKEPVKKEEIMKTALEKAVMSKPEKIKQEIINKTTKKKPSSDEITNAKKTSTKTTTTSKEANVKTSLVLQYQSIEVTEETLISKVKETWAKAHKKSEKDIKSIELYIKPEEYSAYYVINDSVKGRVDL